MKDALATFVKVSTNSAIPLLGIGVPTKDEITCTGVFTAVLLVRAKHPGEKKSPPHRGLARSVMDHPPDGTL